MELVESRATPGRQDAPDRDFSWRAVLAGLCIGFFLCCANMYFGLQTGWVTMGSIQAALLGFGFFRLLRLPGFGPKENTLIQTTSVAAATMPLAAGFVGIIPALQIFEASGESASFHFGWGDIFIWSAAVAFFGVFLAVPLRKQTILKEKLRFPSGTATAHLITTLHGRAAKPHTASSGEEIASSGTASEDEEEKSKDKDKEETPITAGGDPKDDQLLMADALGHASLRNVWRILIMCFGVSALYTLLSLFFPILSQIPIFSWIGLSSFTAWHWVITPSLSYVGQGMIMGTRAGLSLLGGAIIGWAILGPMARSLSWTSGPIDSWTTGAKGWLLWLSLAIMLAVKSIAAALKSRRDTRDVVDPASPDQQVPILLWGSGLVLSSVSCFVLVSFAFSIPLYQPLVALILAYGVAVLAVRALGETDLNPVSGVGKVSQLVFAFVAPGNVVSNILAGGIAEAGAQQAGDLMQDLKTGHLVGASPRAQFYGQLIGSGCSVLFSLVAFRLYTAAHSVPSDIFPVPTAEVWLAMARLASGDAPASSFPAHVFPFCIAFAMLTACIPLVTEAYPTVGPWLPSGIAAAVGMYTTPNWTIPRAVGCILNVVWERKDPLSHARYAVVAASGFVLGEGVTSVLTAVMSTMGFDCRLFGRGHHRRNLSTTNIALRSGSAASGVLHLAGAIWLTRQVRFPFAAMASLNYAQFLRLSALWALVFALPVLLLSAVSIQINFRKREILAFSERKRMRTLILNLLLSLIWAIACASTLWQTARSFEPLSLYVPALCGGLSLFAAWNAIYAVLLALGPGEK